MTEKFGIAVHGGAGTIRKQDISPDEEIAYKEGLTQAIETGYALLNAGGKALDAVEAALCVLEDNPLFNAGRGAVFNHEGKHELDAAIMDGRNLKAGAITCVSGIKNPVKLARLVMENSPHVLLSGRGAEEFARSMGMDFETDDYFFDEKRFQQWRMLRDSEKVSLDHSHHFGTAGVVALDRKRNLAAATSTGGMTNKKFGRIGDTPIIGAGTYADNNSCAVSCTGHGEYFIRSVVANDVAKLVEYKKLSLQEAAHLVILQKLKNIGGEGGLIAIDANANISLVFNTGGMYRGWRRNDGALYTGIYNN